jgi:hypothetical protein
MNLFSVYDFQNEFCRITIVGDPDSVSLDIVNVLSKKGWCHAKHGKHQKEGSHGLSVYLVIDSGISFQRVR